MSDVENLTDLIALSVRVLQAPYYTEAQRQAALGTVFGVDAQLIKDQTCFVAEAGSNLVGCGAWSKRLAQFGPSEGRTEQQRLLIPALDSARIRAFFVHPAWARQGIGATILRACEHALFHQGFRRALAVATLAGEPLYARAGYREESRATIPMKGAEALPVVRMCRDFSGVDLLIKERQASTPPPHPGAYPSPEFFQGIGS